MVVFLSLAIFLFCLFFIYLFFVPSEVDILDQIDMDLKGKSIETDCIGGGRIFHEPEKKSILVYGYSQVCCVNFINF